MSCGVYQIINKVNKKAYVGSSHTLSLRKTRHFYLLSVNRHSCKHLQYSYNKYGKSNFEWSILELTDDLIAREQHYIDTLKPEYNSRLIAENNSGFNHTSETKSKISKALKGVIKSEETRLKMSKSQKVIASNDVVRKDRIRQIALARTESPRCKKVKIGDTIFKSLKEARRSLGIGEIKLNNMIRRGDAILM